MLFHGFQTLKRSAFFTDATSDDFYWYKQLTKEYTPKKSNTA